MIGSTNRRAPGRVTSLGILVLLLFAISCGPSGSPPATNNTNAVSSTPSQPGTSNSNAASVTVTNTPIGTGARIPNDQNYQGAAILVYGSPKLKEDVEVRLELKDMAGTVVWDDDVKLNATDGTLRILRIPTPNTEKLKNGGSLSIRTDKNEIKEYAEIDRLDTLGKGRFTTTLSVDVPSDLLDPAGLGTFGSGTFTTPVGITIVVLPTAL